VTLTQIIH